jgi:hypothetical protein
MGRRTSMMRVGLTFVALLVAHGIVSAKGGVAGGGQAGRGTTGTSAVEYMRKYAVETQIVRGCLKPPVTGSLYSLTDAVDVKGGTESGPKKTYTIFGMIPPNVKLKDHVNHKVELSGTMMEGGKFDMADFKMVSPTCP